MKLREALLIGALAAGCHGEREDEVLECQEAWGEGLVEAKLDAQAACEERAVEEGRSVAPCREFDGYTTEQANAVCEEEPGDCEAGVFLVCDYISKAWFDRCNFEPGATAGGCFLGLNAYFDGCLAAAEAECRRLLD